MSNATAILTLLKDENGQPLALITGSASELVPTIPGAHVLIGPITSTRLVPAGTREELALGMAENQRVVEEIVATERRLVQWSKSGGIQP